MVTLALLFEKMTEIEYFFSTLHCWLISTHLSTLPLAAMAGRAILSETAKYKHRGNSSLGFQRLQAFDCLLGKPSQLKWKIGSGSQLSCWWLTQILGVAKKLGRILRPTCPESRPPSYGQGRAGRGWRWRRRGR